MMIAMITIVNALGPMMILYFLSNNNPKRAVKEIINEAIAVAE